MIGMPISTSTPKNNNNNIPDLKVPSKRNIERIKNSETENAKKKKRKKGNQHEIITLE